MQCPKCQTLNPEGKKFCRQCGAKLSLSCPRCTAEILPGDNFCGACGLNLTHHFEPDPRGLSFDEMIQRMQRYLPRGLTERVLSQRDKIEGERRQVTVMFCDMEEFSRLVETIGPEEAYSLMEQVYEILLHNVHDYEGIR
jgi:predicted amidophosphoribosyltransferase